MNLVSKERKLLHGEKFTSDLTYDIQYIDIKAIVTFTFDLLTLEVLLEWIPFIKETCVKGHFPWQHILFLDVTCKLITLYFTFTDDHDIQYHTWPWHDQTENDLHHMTGQRCMLTLYIPVQYCCEEIKLSTVDASDVKLMCVNQKTWCMIENTIYMIDSK